MKMLKKLMALTLCVMLVSTTMVFTAYAANDAKTVLAVYDFEEYDVGSQLASFIKVGGGGKAAHRRVVDGAEQATVKNGKALQITQHAYNDKHKITGLITSSVVKKDVEYIFSVTAKMADASPVDTQTAVLELYSESKTNAVYTSEAVELTKNEWKTITYTYTFNDSTNADKIATMVGTRLTGEITTGSEPVYLIDDVRIIRNAADTSSFDEDRYNYVSKVFINMDTASKNYFSSGSSRAHTTSYNYSGSTMGAISYPDITNAKYRARSSSSATGVISADELVVGKKYRYSAMMRIDDSDTLHSNANVNFGAFINTDSTTSKNFSVFSTFPIYRDAWTMVWVEVEPTETLKCTSLGFQMVTYSGDTNTYDIIIDDLKIEEIVPNPIWTSFTFGEDEVDAIGEAGDYTANVTFNETFTEDNATVAFAKYVDGVLDGVDVRNSADLVNGETKTFTIDAEELDTTRLSVFVWNNITDLFPLIKGLTITK